MRDGNGHGEVGSEGDDDGGQASWQAFVVANGWRVPIHHLAAVLGRPQSEIARVRSAAARAAKPKVFAELFALWHGREPLEADWPIARRRADAHYEWLAPEEALLATLAGQLSVRDIASTLTARLRWVTGDALAMRNAQACQLRLNRLGLQSSDLVGGVSVAAAARELGSREVVYDAIRDGSLRTRKVGRLVLIPHEQWRAWMARRRPPPAGKIRLSTLREPLGIRSDSKLPEFAQAGFIPTAERHCPDAGTQRGEWYVAEDIAKQLIEDRRLGRPMPWHGKPLDANLRKTFGLWQSRRHPPACETCRHIWGEAGAPETWEVYRSRYPNLDHGAKRHLTRVWTPGVTVEAAAGQANKAPAEVYAAIANGVLRAVEIDGMTRISQTDLTRWIARRCPSGESHRSWLSWEFAQRLYGFSPEELQGYVADGTLRSKVGENGSMRGVAYVLKQQCADLRARLGYSIDDAAARAGVSVARMQELLQGVQWRAGDRVPLDTLQAVTKRLQSREGLTIAEAADQLGQSEAWVQDRISEGLIRVHATRWNPGRLYISAPMLKRLERAMAATAAGDTPLAKLSAEWLNLSAAALLAGVSLATLRKWNDEGDLPSLRTRKGPVVHQDEVKRRAARYWQSVRFHRAVPPDWLHAHEEGSTTAAVQGAGG